MSMWVFKKRESKETKEAVKFKIDERKIEMVADKVKETIEKSVKTEIIFLCIGSDRSTGDSLGPFVGTMLKEGEFPYHVYGTLEEPVHALNLERVLMEIDQKYENPLIFGIDACLGDEHQVGSILFKEEPFLPGKALNKNLPEVGEMHLRAVVNYFNPLSPAQSLNDTRLYTVITLAKAITKIVRRSIKNKQLELR